MGTIEKLQAAGLDVQFDSFMDEFFLDDAKKDQLRTMVDQRGLTDPVVMKTIGVMQREKVMQVGIYKQFKALQAELDDPSGESAPQSVDASEAPASDSETAQSPSGGNGHSAAAEPSDEEVEARIAAYSFSSEQEEMIKQRLKAEEEKIRKRLLAQEKKIREQIVTGRVRKRTRLGLKPEQAKEFTEAREAIKKNQAKIKELRAENAQHKKVIERLRPKRNVTPSTPAQKQLRVAKRKLTMAINEKNDTLIEQAKLNLAKAEQVLEAEQAQLQV